MRKEIKKNKIYPTALAKPNGVSWRNSGQIFLHCIGKHRRAAAAYIVTERAFSAGAAFDAGRNKGHANVPPKPSFVPAAIVEKAATMGRVREGAFVRAVTVAARQSTCAHFKTSRRGANTCAKRRGLAGRALAMVYDNQLTTNRTNDLLRHGQASEALPCLRTVYDVTKMRLLRTHIADVKGSARGTRYGEPTSTPVKSNSKYWPVLL